MFPRLSVQVVEVRLFPSVSDTLPSIKENKNWAQRCTNEHTENL